MADFQFKLVRAVQLGAAVLILLGIVFYAGAWNVWRITGLVIAVPSLVLLFIARFQLGDSFAVTPQAKVLVTRGLYSKIRNPIYVFSFLLVLGLLLAIHRPYLYPLLAIILVVQVVRVRQESRVLEEKFGEEYRQYRKRTWF
jgi:protein-S-isoprenylcysteine O-methyltransferase Ste14